MTANSLLILKCTAWLCSRATEGLAATAADRHQRLVGEKETPDRNDLGDPWRYDAYSPINVAFGRRREKEGRRRFRRGDAGKEGCADYTTPSTQQTTLLCYYCNYNGYFNIHSQFSKKNVYNSSERATQKTENSSFFVF